MVDLNPFTETLNLNSFMLQFGLSPGHLSYTQDFFLTRHMPTRARFGPKGGRNAVKIARATLLQTKITALIFCFLNH